MGRLLPRNYRLRAFVLIAALALGACQSVKTTQPDRDFYVPNWCQPHGCSWGGGG